MTDCCGSARLKRNAKLLLVVLTLLQMLYFIGYLTVYLIESNAKKDPEDSYSFH